jgi:hypothetical protein
MLDPNEWIQSLQIYLPKVTSKPYWDPCIYLTWIYPGSFPNKLYSGVCPNTYCLLDTACKVRPTRLGSDVAVDGRARLGDRRLSRSGRVNECRYGMPQSSLICEDLLTT